MYYCLTCDKIHQHDMSAERIFESGYILVNDTKVPLGICKTDDNKKKKRSLQFN